MVSSIDSANIRPGGPPVASPELHLRPELRDVAGYRGGSAVPGAVKLSSNESGFEPLPGVLSAVHSASSDLNRYPDNHATTLRLALAERWGLGIEELTVGCGSSLLCQELVQATCSPGDLVAFGWRSFEAYVLYARTAHAESLTVPNAPDGAIDLPALASAINAHPGRVGIVFLCSPNNPTGQTVDRSRLEQFLDAIPASIPVVIDEAYQDFATDNPLDAIELYRGGRRNVIALRTFSKAHGLAGLRIGYAAGAPEILAAVEAIRSPFSVTAIAQAAALASLAASEELGMRVASVVAERSRVSEELAGLGLPVLASQANFLWLPLGDGAEEFADHCRSQGVLVRVFPSEGVRVSISVWSDNERFLSAARRWARSVTHGQDHKERGAHR
jgi:histidinol-phosphate aminotransferase